MEQGEIRMVSIKMIMDKGGTSEKVQGADEKVRSITINLDNVLYGFKVPSWLGSDDSEELINMLLDSVQEEEEVYYAQSHILDTGKQLLISREGWKNKPELAKRVVGWRTDAALIGEITFTENDKILLQKNGFEVLF